MITPKRSKCSIVKMENDIKRTYSQAYRNEYNCEFNLYK